MDIPQPLALTLLLLLIAMNALFVTAEFALVSARRTRLEQLAEQGNRLARTALRFMDDPNLFISAAQVGITIASLGIGWLGEPALANLFSQWLTAVPSRFQTVAAHTLAFALAFILITLLHIVYGEQVPKMIAIQRAEQLAMVTAAIMRAISIVFRPAILLVYWLTELTLRPFGLRYEPERHLVYSVEELEMLVESSAESGEIDPHERELIQRVLAFSELTAYQIMVPRTELIALPATISFPTLIETIARERRSRYPVYDGTIDQIIGVLHVKDLFRLLQGQCFPEELNLRGLVRQALTVPESLPVSELLRLMQAQHTQVAIVIDEFGGTAGLATLEDVVEHIIGETQDEFERPERDIEILPNGDVLVNGLLLIDEVNERFGLAIEDENFDTIGGYVFGQLGRKPEIGDEIQVGNYRLRVEALDGLRISRLRLSPIQPAEEALEETANTPASPTAGDAKASRS